MDFNKNEIFKLINLYRQFDCLWNYKSSTYKRVDLKKNAWLEIASKLHKEVEEVKKKIKYLRSAYVAEKKKVEKSKKSGSSTESLYETHLYYFSEMQFLDSVVVLRKTVSTLETENMELGFEAEETFGEFLSEEYLESLPPSGIPSTSIEITPVPSISPPMPSPTETASMSSSSRRCKRKRETQRDSKIDRAIEAIVASATNEDNDMYDLFSKTIAAQLKQLPPIEATKTMSEIHQLVTQKMINFMSASQSSLSNSSSERDLMQSSLSEADISFL